MDVHAKSQQLLESLANSIHDRSENSKFVFNISEVHITEEWIKNLINEIKKEEK